MVKTLTKQISLIIFALIPLSYVAQTVVISEVGFRSSASSDDYVELYNTTGSAINLNNYTLVPSTGSTVTITGSIPANGYFIIAKNTAQASFESTWGVTLGASVGYYNSGNVLSTTSGVTFTLNNASAVALDNTTGYGITLGTRLYQCPVGSFLGNDQSETTTADCTPGGVKALSVDDLTHWTVSRYNNAWDVGTIDGTTGSENLIVKYRDLVLGSTHMVNDVFMVNGFIRSTTHVFNVSGDLYLNHLCGVDVTGTGSITVTGTIYMKRTGVNSENKYNLWASPYSSTSSNILTDFSGVNPCDVYAYQATTQEWKHDYSVPFSTTCNGAPVTITSTNVLEVSDGTADGVMDIGRGYFIPGSASSATRTLTGSTFNNGNIFVPIYGSSVAIAGGNDWNLIGNPYPSSIFNSKFLTNSTNATLFNSVYVYDGNTGIYQTLNSSTYFFLASLQSFYVNATSTTDGFLGNAEFTNSMRFHTNVHWRNQNQTMFISLNQDSLSDPIQVILDANSEDSFDQVHDAFKLPNQNNFNIATYIDTELCVFNGIKPISENQTKTVKIYVQTPDAGNFEITLDSMNLIGNNIQIRLEDKQTNVFTDLRGSSYSFSTTQGETFDNRFFLHLTNTVTSINEINNELNVSIYSANDIVNINTIGETTITKIEMYDVLGKNIYNSTISLDNHVINVNGYQSGIYFVKVYGENGKLTTKRIFVD